MIASLLRAGKTPKQIRGKLANVTSQRIGEIRRKLGMRGFKSGRPKGPADMDSLLQVAALRGTGMGFGEIAKKLKLNSRQTAYARFKKFQQVHEQNN